MILVWSGPVMSQYPTNLNKIFADLGCDKGCVISMDRKEGIGKPSVTSPTGFWRVALRSVSFLSVGRNCLHPTQVHVKMGGTNNSGSQMEHTQLNSVTTSYKKAKPSLD